MNNIEKLRKECSVEIEAPFTLKINGKKHKFECLIIGYGSKNGMVVDKTGSNINFISNELTSLGYGHSCFNINKISVVGFQNALNDWGKTSV